MRGALFHGLAGRLGPGFELYAPDLPGHGTAAAEAPGLAACARRAAEAIAATGRDDVILVGWSFGAAVAWACLAEHGQERVSGLVTVDMSPKLANRPGWDCGLLGQEPGRLQRTTGEIRSDWPRAAGKIATSMFASRAGAPGYSREDALAQILSNDPAKMAAVWDAMLAMDLRGSAAGVTCPWIVAHGAKSRVYPDETARWLAGVAPQARLARFEHSGHSPHLEEPDAFAEMLRDFSAELDRRQHRQARRV
jgi:pimeloyl-[acyl-carrier protein] methyl ester esterase